VAGAHVLHANNRAAPAPTQGFVTTAVWSPVLNRWVGLGLVRGGHRRMGEQVNLFDAGHITPALITGVCAYDRGGERLHG
jgi:sarcosine oxidase subunit alpha